MEIITRKPIAKQLCEQCIEAYFADGLNHCVEELEKLLLSRKVKFPILEYVAELFYTKIATQDHIRFCDQIQALHTEGGNVLLGKILQLRLTNHYQQSLQKAVEYTSQADVWYVSDIIGERVFGVALLQHPEQTVSEIQRLSTHSSHWVVRSLGAGIHYAIKKGLGKHDVILTFKTLLLHANDQNKEIRQGIGWAAKTTAKFHPDIIAKFNDQIANPEAVANWFRKKISIGLARNNHAQRNTR